MASPSANVLSQGTGIQITITHPNHAADAVAAPPGLERSFQCQAPWLWHTDPAFVHPSSGQRTRSLSSYYVGGWRIQECRMVSESGFPAPPPGSLHPTAASIYLPQDKHDPPQRQSYQEDASELGFLHVTWRNRQNQSMDSCYSLSWLESCCGGGGSPWTRSIVTPAQAISRQRPPEQFDMADLSAAATSRDREETLHQLLHTLVQDGAVLIRQAPSVLSSPPDTTDATVLALAHWLAGGPSHGHLYGDTFHVLAKAHANNIAYTSEPLPPHQDLAYYESQPGLQLLHCVSNDNDTILGGESTLVDAMAAATMLQSCAPRLFQALTRHPATFVKQRNDTDMVYRGPHVSVHANGEVVGVRWSPPFEGPVMGVAPEDLPEFFVAKHAMELLVDNSVEPLAEATEEGRAGAGDDSWLLSLLPLELQKSLREYAKEYTWEYRLQPGDVLVFNNQRMLHGRRGFTMTSAAKDGDRHLVGCYTNMEETLNRYRLLRRERMRENPSLRIHCNVGNNSLGG